MTTSPEPEVISFATSSEWSEWLAQNHTLQHGIWLRMYKKGSGIPSINYAQALDEALCYGWIDGQKKSYDDTSWIQRFVPRRAKSVWSQINCGHIERLTAEGRMEAPGLQAVEDAKADGRWDAAYASQKSAAPPEDFLSELNKNEAAKGFFGTLNKANVYAILYRIQDAKKPETREKRIRTFIEMLARGEKIHG